MLRLVAVVVAPDSLIFSDRPVRVGRTSYPLVVYPPHYFMTLSESAELCFLVSRELVTLRLC